MKRNIFIVDAQIVDANGTFNKLSGYPKLFDSRSYSDDVDKTLQRARGEFHEAFGAMCKRDDRQLQVVILMTADGFVLDRETIGEIADLPDSIEPSDESGNESE